MRSASTVPAVLAFIVLLFAGCANGPTQSASSSAPTSLPTTSTRASDSTAPPATPAPAPALAMSWVAQEGLPGPARALVPWRPMKCDPSGVAEVAAPRGRVGWTDANATAAAVTAALGLHVQEGGGTWTEAGYWRANLTEGGWFTFLGTGLGEISWVLPEGYWPATDSSEAIAKVDAILAAVPWPESMRLEANMTQRTMTRPVGPQSSMSGSVVQTVNGTEVATVLAFGYRIDQVTVPTTLRPDTGLSIYPGFEGAASEPLADPFELGAWASQFIACGFGGENEVSWPATLVRRGDRLVWELHVVRQPGGLVNVDMDALTGAVLQPPPIPPPSH